MDDFGDLEVSGELWEFPPVVEPGKQPGPKSDDNPLGAQWIILPHAQARSDVATPAQPPWNGILLFHFFLGDLLVRFGTGFFIDQHVVLTARHNLRPQNYNRGSAWIAADAVRNPGAQAVTIRSHAVHPVLDLAALIVAEAAPYVFQMDGAAPPPGSATLAGYSMPYPNGDVRFSKASGPVVFGNDGTTIGYGISTRPGDSGAPVFAAVPGGATRALGIHTEGTPGDAPLNAGIRFTRPVVTEVERLVTKAMSFIQ